MIKIDSEKEKFPIVRIVYIEKNLHPISDDKITDAIDLRNGRELSELKIKQKYRNNKSGKWRFIAEFNNRNYQMVMKNKKLYFG